MKAATELQTATDYADLRDIALSVSHTYPSLRASQHALDDFVQDVAVAVLEEAACKGRAVPPAHIGQIAHRLAADALRELDTVHHLTRARLKAAQDDLPEGTPQEWATLAGMRLETVHRALGQHSQEVSWDELAVEPVVETPAEASDEVTGVPQLLQALSTWDGPEVLDAIERKLDGEDVELTEVHLWAMDVHKTPDGRGRLSSHWKQADIARAFGLKDARRVREALSELRGRAEAAKQALLARTR